MHSAIEPFVSTQSSPLRKNPSEPTLSYRPPNAFVERQIPLVVPELWRSKLGGQRIDPLPAGHLPGSWLATAVTFWESSDVNSYTVKDFRSLQDSDRDNQAYRQTSKKPGR